MRKTQSGWLWATIAAALLGAAQGCSEPDDVIELYTNESEPAPWEPNGTLDLDLFPTGVQITNVTSQSALVALRTEATMVDLMLQRGSAQQWQEIRRTSGFSPAQGKMLHHTLNNLEPDTPYSLVFYADNRTRRSRVTRFRTAPTDSQSRVLRFGATSCLGKLVPSLPTLSRAAEDRLDFMLLAGDTVYTDGSGSLPDYRRSWKQAFETQGMRDLSSSTSMITTWDDHEILNNWTWDKFDDSWRFENARTAYIEALPILEETIWRKRSWGKTLDVLVLDSRGERRNGNYLSIDQMEWLKTELLTSNARFKVVLNSVPITDMRNILGTLEISDRWQGFPQQRFELLNFIEDHDIQGVFFVGGDFHYGQIAQVSPPGEPGSKLWEILVGPGGSLVNPFMLTAPKYDEQFKLFVAAHTYTYFEANPKTGKVLVRYVDAQGETLGERTLQL
jgi:alkaline phosphatase D